MKHSVSKSLDRAMNTATGAESMSRLISSSVAIMTVEELEDIKQTEYQRGVRRGLFEAQHGEMRVAANCANWTKSFAPDYGQCDKCGVQHQDCQVHADFACPHFVKRSKQ